MAHEGGIGARAALASRGAGRCRAARRHVLRAGDSAVTPSTQSRGVYTGVTVASRCLQINGARKLKTRPTAQAADSQVFTGSVLKRRRL